MKLRVTDLSRGGAGVAKDPQGRVVFIPFSVPGDEIEVQIESETKNYAQGKILKILQPSPIRQTPPCPVFGQCGGCQWQHVPYSLQWQTKVKGVRQALQRVHVQIPELFDEIPAEQIWGYRNRIQLRGFQSELGFYQGQSHELVPVDHCETARPEINLEWKAIQAEGSQLLEPFKVEVEVLPGGKVRKIWNARHGSAGFRQIHDQQNHKLQDWILNHVEEGDQLLDLFGGSGNFSLPLVGKFKEIHCVDLTVPRVRPNGVPDHLFFHSDSVLRWLLKKAAVDSQKPKPMPTSLAIIDPPRQGLGSQLSEIGNALEALHVRKIVAIGCDLDSWVKDLSHWIERGWKLNRAAVVDFFPQTPHIESVALLNL